jgi:hypothetical protein
LLLPFQSGFRELGRAHLLDDKKLQNQDRDKLRPFANPKNQRLGPEASLNLP